MDPTATTTTAAAASSKGEDDWLTIPQKKDKKKKKKQRPVPLQEFFSSENCSHEDHVEYRDQLYKIGLPRKLIHSKRKGLPETSSLISCDAVLNRSKNPVPRGTSILLQFWVKIWPNLAKIHENCIKTASQLINELTSGFSFSSQSLSMEQEERRGP